MIKAVKLFKKIFGFRKYLSYIYLILNAVQSVRRDLWHINRGDSVVLVDEDKDGKYDILEPNEDITEMEIEA